MYLRNLHVFTSFCVVVLTAAVFIGACCPCNSSGGGESGDAQVGSIVERLSKWAKKQNGPSGDDLLDSGAQPQGSNSVSTANEITTGGELSPTASKVFENLKSEGFSPTFPVNSTHTAGLSITIGQFADNMSVNITEYDSEKFAKTVEDRLRITFEKEHLYVRVIRKGKAVITLQCRSMAEERCMKAVNAVSK